MYNIDVQLMQGMAGAVSEREEVEIEIEIGICIRYEIQYRFKIQNLFIFMKMFDEFKI